MFIKINTKNNILKLTTMPVLLLASLLSVFFSFQLSTSTYAATYLNLSISRANVDFHFNQAENTASSFKEDSTIVHYNTNNITGFTAYVSSIDEDTSLNHTDSSVTQKITSITSPSNVSSFNSKNWGYITSQSIYSGGTFMSIPKSSQPDQVLHVSTPKGAKFFLHFGVKTGPDLPAGTYSKKILVTAIPNHAPTTATLKVGTDFVSTIGSLDGLSGIKEFKRSATAPAAGVSTKIASIPTSEMPVYLWYDTPSKTVFWWSDADTVYANEDSHNMFHNIGDVERIDMTGINTSRVKNMSRMFHSGMNIYKHIELSGFDTSNAEDMSYMFATSGLTTPVSIDPIDFSRFNTSKVKNMEGMFLNSFLPSLDIKNFDTSNVKNMSLMFGGLKNVRNLDLSGWNVKKVNNIQAIFTRSNNLQSLNLSGWQMDSVTSMYSMFSGLINLTSLNLTGFTTKNVTNMQYMFADVRKLADLDLSSFDTSKVTTMNSMFGNMFSLNNINLSSFNTSNVTDMSGLFMVSNIMNPQISRLDLSNFDTSNVTNMNRMFYGLSNLTELKIQSFNTKKVKNMSGMFARSFMNSDNGILDISSFDTRSVTEMSNMFIFSKLKTIYASPSFVTTAITVPLLSPNDPFMNNTNLVGGNGTHYVHPNNSGQYAHIDAPGNPGYFTQKP